MMSNLDEPECWPEYSSREMAIRESQSEPQRWQFSFKDLAKRFQTFCGMFRGAVDRIGNLEREVRNLKRENQDLKRENQDFKREMAGTMKAMANAIAQLEAQ